MTRARHKRQSGYTLIEVMMSVAIMTAGSVGILAMQQATTRGNQQARTTTVATDITRRWVERIRRESLRWNNPGSPVTASYIDAALPGGTGTTSWIQPANLVGPPLRTRSFDYQGNDTTLAGQMVYCTDVNLTWVVPNQAMRVDVRTWWHRRSNDAVIGDLRAFTACAPGAAPAITAELNAAIPRLHAVYASTTIRWNMLPR